MSYIRREDALACFHDWIDKRGDVHTADEMPEYEAIANLPPADVRPMTKAKWMWDLCSRRVCSNCGCPVGFMAEKTGWREGDYCQGCGAYMKEGTA